MGWYLLAFSWLGLVSVFGFLVSLRAIRHSEIARMIDLRDVPILHFLETHYALLYWGGTALGVLVAAITGMDSFRRRRGWGLCGMSAAFTSAVLYSSRYAYSSAGGLLVQPARSLDWLSLALVAAASWLMARRIGASRAGSWNAPHLTDLEAPRQPFLLRIGIVYLVSCGAVAALAVREHLEFWNPAANGGYDYARFFLEGERASAELVLYSTSALFGSLAALLGCAGYVLLEVVSRAGRRTGLALSEIDVRLQSVTIAVVWTLVAGVPWQVKLLPEIRREDGWILPSVILVYLASGLVPVVFTSLSMVKEALDRAHARAVRTDRSSAWLYPRRSEFAFWGMLVFPVVPLFGPLNPRSLGHAYSFLMALSGAVLATATWLVNRVEDWFVFDDWRGMLKAAEFPFLQVFLSILCGYLVCIAASRALGWSSSLLAAGGWRARWAGSRWIPAARPALAGTVFALVCASAVLASYPFWGWRGVSGNVFARLFEFSDRHEFELRFLHWLLDADRDGYAAVLHGADPDDRDPEVVPAGRRAPAAVRPPLDAFEVADPERAARFPNVAIFYLEGVVNRALSAYGERRLPGGLVATPHIDSVARDGTYFTQARCFYPSTWDGWFAVSSGRFLRVSEMRHDHRFGDKYSRYNNLYKVLELAGIERWCHADCRPYYDLLVPPAMRGRRETAWWSEDDGYSSEVAPEEEERGIWRGDKRVERLLAFVDGLRPGERFFLAEHMADSHFPWERTPPERARELGFAGGLEPYEADAVLADGSESDKLARYFQVVTRVDAQIGRVLARLKERGLYDDTIVIIVSDHGCQFWEHEHLYYVSHLYDQSLLVPLIIKIPGIQGGRVSGAPVLQLDVLPTVMELAGVRLADPRDECPLPGRSLLPLLSGDASTAVLEPYGERDVVLMTHYDTFGIISRFRHKLIFDRPSGTCLLFDLVEDPGEMRNVADQRPELRDAMLARLQEMLERHPAVTGSIAP